MTANSRAAGGIAVQALTLPMGGCEAARCHGDGPGRVREAGLCLRSSGSCRPNGFWTCRSYVFWSSETKYLPTHREVCHNHDDCPDGKRIKREPGTGGKPLCKVCSKLG